MESFASLHTRLLKQAFSEYSAEFNLNINNFSNYNKLLSRFQLCSERIEQFNSDPEDSLGLELGIGPLSVLDEDEYRASMGLDIS